MYVIPISFEPNTFVLGSPGFPCELKPAFARAVQEAGNRSYP
jgi:hypothetical protein